MKKSKKKKSRAALKAADYDLDEFGFDVEDDDSEPEEDDEEEEEEEPKPKKKAKKKGSKKKAKKVEPEDDEDDDFGLDDFDDDEEEEEPKKKPKKTKKKGSKAERKKGKKKAKICLTCREELDECECPAKPLNKAEETAEAIGFDVRSECPVCRSCDGCECDEEDRSFVRRLAFETGDKVARHPVCGAPLSVIYLPRPNAGEGPYRLPQFTALWGCSVCTGDALAQILTKRVR